MARSWVSELNFQGNRRAIAVCRAFRVLQPTIVAHLYRPAGGPSPLAGSSTSPMARSSRRRPSATASLQRPLDPGAACTIGTTECQSHDCPKFPLPIAPKSLQRPMSRRKALPHAYYETRLFARRCRRSPHASVGEPLEIRGLEQRVIAIKKTEKIDKRPKSFHSKLTNLSDNAQFNLEELSVTY